MRMLIWMLLIYLVYRMVRSRKTPEVSVKEPAAAETFKDPVCGLYISEDDAVVGRMGEQRYHFCSHKCLQEFEKQQQR